MGDEEEKAIGEIKEALGSPEGCKIEKQKSYYVIEPENSNDKLLIKQLNIPHAFSCNLHFKNCSFKYDIYLIRKTFNSTIKFERCIFKKFVNLNYSKFKTISFIDTIFEDIAYFIGVTFEHMVTFSRSRFKERAFFSHSTFKEKASFEEVIFEHNAYFDDVKFLGEADFRLSEFYETANFENANFLGKTIFIGTQFKKDSLFLNAAFSEAEFNQSKFYQIAYFYGTKFNKTPNFIQVTFNGNINFTNTELDFRYNEVKEKIEETYHKREYDSEQDKEDKKYKEEPKRYKIANEFRDSFRNIKSALIEHHNMLDASNYHRVELYCKELELEYKKEEESQNSTTRDFIDTIQLYCYRVTSDHHTDLLLIFNNIIFLIALFGVANLVLAFSNQFSIIQFAFLAIDDIKLLEITICIICVAAIMSVMLNYYSIIYFIIFLLIFALVSYINSIYAIFILLMLCVFAVYLMILLYFQSELKGNFTKKIFFVISYPIVILMLIFKPSLILPILGKLLENKTSETCLFIFDKFKLICFSATSITSETLNLIYMLFLFLLLFSLQKTARKNTIVSS